MFAVPVNVACRVLATGLVFGLVGHLPLAVLGRSPWNTTDTVPLPVAPLNLPVDWLPTTLNSTTV